MNGTVKFFDTRKNFGFIAGEDGKDYFVHVSETEDQKGLYENDKVEFTPEEGDRGLVAKEVKKE